MLISRTMTYVGDAHSDTGEPFRGGPVLLAHQTYDDLRRKIHRVTRGTVPRRPSLACSSVV